MAASGGTKTGRRGDRTLRTVLVALLVLAAVLLLANAAFAWFVERRAESALEARLGAAAEVDLSGFPVSPRLLTGSLPGAEISVEGVRLPGTDLSLGRLDVALSGVRYEGDREGPLDPPIEARSARFRSSFTEDEVSDLAGALPGVEGAELTDGGLRLLLVGGVETDAGLAVEDGGLVLRPDTPILDPSVPLVPGRLPGGADIEEARVRGGRVVVEGGTDGLGVRE